MIFVSLDKQQLMKKIFIILLLSALLTFIPLSIVWLQGQFISGINPFLAAIIIPLLFVMDFFISRRLIKAFKKYISFTPAVLFAIASCSYVILIFVLQIYYGNSAMDIHLHDTYFIVSYTYPHFFVAIGFAIFAAVYQWFSKLFAVEMNITLGYIHSWITFLCASILLLPMPYFQLTNMTRRYYDYSSPQVYNALHGQSIFILIAALLLAIAQLLFVFNFCNSIFRRKK